MHTGGSADFTEWSLCSGACCAKHHPIARILMGCDRQTVTKKRHFFCERVSAVTVVAEFRVVRVASESEHAYSMLTSRARMLSCWERGESGRAEGGRHFAEECSWCEFPAYLRPGGWWLFQQMLWDKEL